MVRTQVAFEFFPLESLRPRSDLYITERLVDTARQAGLTGLEFLELVHDEGSVIPIYSGFPCDRPPNYQSELEPPNYELIRYRADTWCYPEAEYMPLLLDAASKGLVATRWEQPVRHIRSLDQL